MKLYRSFEIKWYHLLFGLLGLVAVVLALFWVFISKNQVKNFVEEETDMVA